MLKKVITAYHVISGSSLGYLKELENLLMLKFSKFQIPFSFYGSSNIYGLKERTMFFICQFLIKINVSIDPIASNASKTDKVADLQQRFKTSDAFQVCYYLYYFHECVRFLSLLFFRKFSVLLLINLLGSSHWS